MHDNHAILEELQAQMNTTDTVLSKHTCLQAIQVETSPGCVETGILHMIDTNVASPADTRVSAMHERDPIHTMMFNTEGVLLTANKAALHAFHIDTTGNLTVCSLLCAGLFACRHNSMHAAIGKQCMLLCLSHCSAQ